MLRRIRWRSRDEGSSTPLDQTLDVAEATVRLGVREMAFRLCQVSSGFAKAAENLARTAGVHLGGETLRKLVESEGGAVRQRAQRGRLAVGWKGSDCVSPEGPTRVYLRSDGVKVSLITDAAMKLRRQVVRQRRQGQGRRARPLPPRKPGADQRYKEFKLVAYCDESSKHCYVSVTRGDHRAAGRLMRRDARRFQFQTAEEKVANVDGADWREQPDSGATPLPGRGGLGLLPLGRNLSKGPPRRLRRRRSGRSRLGRRLLHLVKHQGYEPFWERLTAWRGSLRSCS